VATPHPSRFTPRITLYPLYRRLGGSPEPFWMGAENLALTEIRSPDRPARSESLYRLSYPGPMQGWVLSYNSPRKAAHSGGKKHMFWLSSKRDWERGCAAKSGLKKKNDDRNAWVDNTIRLKAERLLAWQNFRCSPQPLQIIPYIWSEFLTQFFLSHQSVLFDIWNSAIKQTKKRKKIKDLATNKIENPVKS